MLVTNYYLSRFTLTCAQNFERTNFNIFLDLGSGKLVSHGTMFVKYSKVKK